MRAAIFIDGAYLLNRVHEASFAPDYSKLADYFLAPLRRNVPLDLLRCYFYDCPPWMSSSPSEDERRRMAVHDRFVEGLEDLDRWSVRLGKLERRREDGRDVFAQKRVDVLLAVDMVRHAAAGHIQHAVVVAGDSDFIPAVMTAKECGATVTIWCAADRTPHKDLLVAADEVCYFDWNTFPTRERPATRGKATPVARPSSAPVARPSSAPDERPSSAPDERPSSAPVARPSSAPVARPSSAPDERPTASPAASAAEETLAKKSPRGGRGKKSAAKAAPPPPPPPPPHATPEPAEPELLAEVGGNESSAPGNGKRRRRGKRGGRRRKKAGPGGDT